MIKTEIRKAILILICAYFLLLLYWMFIGFGRTNHSYEVNIYNLRPFDTIEQYMNIGKYNFDTWVINMIGNIGVFIPFGICLPIIYRISYIKFVVLFGVTILLLEILQMYSKRGIFDIDDIILNTLGATIGYIIFKTTRKIFVLITRRSGN